MGELRGGGGYVGLEYTQEGETAGIHGRIGGWGGYVGLCYT